MAEDRGYKTRQHIWDQGCARRFPELGDPKRRNLHGIGYRMAGVACPRVNQYEYLTSIGPTLLLAELVTQNSSDSPRMSGSQTAWRRRHPSRQTRRKEFLPALD